MRREKFQIKIQMRQHVLKETHETSIHGLKSEQNT